MNSESVIRASLSDSDAFREWWKNGIPIGISHVSLLTVYL